MTGDMNAPHCLISCIWKRSPTLVFTLHEFAQRNGFPSNWLAGSYGCEAKDLSEGHEAKDQATVQPSEPWYMALADDNNR